MLTRSSSPLQPRMRIRADVFEERRDPGDGRRLRLEHRKLGGHRSVVSAIPSGLVAGIGKEAGGIEGLLRGPMFGDNGKDWVLQVRRAGRPLWPRREAAWLRHR